ncbi:signal recognition particle-docking protein FtsY [Hahella sp. SMD15-11]|uniref:Signal recognition particle receptor FtsY n=1 Tax=Thermohahella caldifontis TaxID=3142973 RepID=A0AB39UU07_9GAMM
MLLLLGLLVLFFVADVVGRKRRQPRPPRIELRPPAPASGKKAAEAVPEKPAGQAEAVSETPEAPVQPVAETPVAPAAPAGEVAGEVAREVRPEAAPEVVPEAAEKAPSLFARIRSGLSKTRAGLADQIKALVGASKKIDEDLLEEIETILLTADVGIEATSAIIESLTEKLERNALKDSAALNEALREELRAMLRPCEQPLEITGHKPFVILVVGVNGVGKTTTIGKLARKFRDEGKTVLLAAGDTFRAAAVEQLQVWGERNQVPVVAQHTGADSASVIFDAIAAAKARNIDVVIADTAGRLQNKDNLMAELEKVVRVIRKHDETAPHEVLLVLDAGTGQNALSQASLFTQAVGVSGLVVTKLDGTAKGGILFAIARKLGTPIRFIGVGEGVEDLRPFRADEFVDALFDDQDSDQA